MQSLTSKVEELSSKIDKLIDNISSLVKALQLKVERRQELDRSELEASG